MTEAGVVRLFRPDLAALEPYTPIHPFEVVSRRLGRDPAEIVKLDANENPYGPSLRALEALADYRWHHIYPDPQSIELRAALSRFLGVPAANIMAGSGADELIDLVGRLFLAPGDGVIDCPPTFGMYSFDAAINGASVVNVPRRSDFSVDADAIERLCAPSGGYDEFGWLEADTDVPSTLPPLKLLFICSPNNPDGGLIARADLERLLALPLVVVLDQAYVEFAGPEHSYAGWPLVHPNLIVLRTFSKWAGLGGLRVGYGVFPDAIIQQLWKIKQPYNVNSAGNQAALASLADEDYLLGNVARLVAERERLAVELGRIGYLEPVTGSRSNFLLCRGRGARRVPS